MLRNHLLSRKELFHACFAHRFSGEFSRLSRLQSLFSRRAVTWSATRGSKSMKNSAQVGTGKRFFVSFSKDLLTSPLSVGETHGTQPRPMRAVAFFAYANGGASYT